MISWRWRRTVAMARSSSSSVRSTIFLPNTMRSSAPVMPTSAIERTAVSRSGEDSSVMAAVRKRALIGLASSARISLMPRLAASVENVPRSRIRELAEIAMSMDGVLRLYFGESNLPTPGYIKQAAYRAMEDGFTFYTENAGLPSLRLAIATNYRSLHGVELDPASEIVVTASGVQALNLGIRCALDPGDEALVLTPAWPNGPSSVMMANATVRQIPQPLCGER